MGAFIGKECFENGSIDIEKGSKLVTEDRMQQVSAHEVAYLFDKLLSAAQRVAGVKERFSNVQAHLDELTKYEWYVSSLQDFCSRYLKEPEPWPLPGIKSVDQSKKFVQKMKCLVNNLESAASASVRPAQANSWDPPFDRYARMCKKDCNWAFVRQRALLRPILAYIRHDFDARGHHNEDKNYATDFMEDVSKNDVDKQLEKHQAKISQKFFIDYFVSHKLQ